MDRSLAWRHHDDSREADARHEEPGADAFAHRQGEVGVLAVRDSSNLEWNQREALDEGALATPSSAKRAVPA